MLYLSSYIPLTATPILPKLIRSYLKNETAVNHLSALPFTFEGLDSFIADRQKFATNRPLLVEVLKKQYAIFEENKKVGNNIIALLDSNTFTVVAAHQPSLFLGPMYNLVKISAAIVSSIELKKKYPVYNFVPVFWLGSEDHDKEELCNTFVGSEKVSWETANEGAIGKFENNGLDIALEKLLEYIPSNQYTDFLKNNIDKFADFGQLTQALVHEVFKDFGLVVLDQNEASFKQAFTPFIKEEIQQKIAQNTLAKSNEWLAQNYHQQVNPRDFNFFLLSENNRIRITQDTQGIYWAGDEKIGNEMEMLSLIEKSPARCSPNVVFRPLLQELILPNLCFVGGSGELSYWLQLKPLFDYFKLPFPILAHRPVVSILTKNLSDKMAKLGLTIEDFFEDENTIIKNWIEKQATEDVTLAKQKSEIEAVYKQIIPIASQIDKSLEATVNAELQRALNSLENLSGKLIKAEKRNQETAVNQMRNIKQYLYPQNTLRERSENSLSWLSTLNREEFEQFVMMQNPAQKSMLNFVF
jgi:bacillithiol biosynthesis cysteine-adding enzyme BshC